MRLRNNIFAAAFDYLKREKGIKTQKRLAELMGVSEDTITRILKDRCDVTEDIITKLQTASGCIFNLQWLRGEDSTHMLVADMVDEPQAPQPEIPDFIQKLFDEAVRMQTRNELLERQCEQLIAELRVSKDKNDIFLAELRKSQEFNDSLVAELKISRTQNDTLITELRESRKKFDAVVKELDGLKDQFSMALSQHPNFTEEDLGVLRVNDKGEAILTIQVPPVKATTKSKSKTKNTKAPVGYIRGNVKVITDKMVQQAIAAFPQNKK
jgi:transcriptional regulator with XRE-family HTH domain